MKGNKITIIVPGASIQAEVRGDGIAVIMIPSLGRDGRDFDDLGVALAADGFMTVSLWPRGTVGGNEETHPVTLHGLAADVGRTMDVLSLADAFVLGHAFGNRVARCFAADYPERTRGVVLLAAGGKHAPAPDALNAFRRFLRETLDDTQKHEAMRVANFAPGNDPTPWLQGWWPDAVRLQVAATEATPRGDWWHAGNAQILAVQGLQDRMALPENGRDLQRDFPDRVVLREIDGAGHAMLCEQPRAVHHEVRQFLMSAVTDND